MGVLNKLTEKLLNIISLVKDDPKTSYSIREDGTCTSYKSSDNVTIVPKTDRPGIDVYVKDNAIDELIYIPSCVSQGGIDDVVFNDFHVGENCRIKIISGCGVNASDGLEARHSGVHQFFVGKASTVFYEEKHLGFDEGTGDRIINPSTYIYLDEDSSLQIDATQISGVDVTKRSTKAELKKNAKLQIKERLFTEGKQTVKSVFKVELNGEDSSADIISRSVARDKSYQCSESTLIGNARCSGHLECDAIIGEEAMVDASPRLFARNKDASMIHEAAIGKIAGDQILKLRTLGLTEEEAENEIIQGFLA